MTKFGMISRATVAKTVAVWNFLNKFTKQKIYIFSKDKKNGYMLTKNTFVTTLMITIFTLLLVNIYSNSVAIVVL